MKNHRIWGILLSILFVLSLPVAAFAQELPTVAETEPAIEQPVAEELPAEAAPPAEAPAQTYAPQEALSNPAEAEPAPEAEPMTMHSRRINIKTGQVVEESTTQAVPSAAGKGLQVGQTLYSDESGMISFVISPAQAGDYQLWKEAEADTEFIVTDSFTDDPSLINMGTVNTKEGHYDNLNLRPGYMYHFSTYGIKSVTLRNDPVDSILLDEVKTGESNLGNLYCFTPAESGRYTVNVKAFDTEFPFIQVNERYVYPPQEGARSFYMKAGETVYVLANSISSFSIVSAGYEINTNITDMWLVRSKEELEYYPVFPPEEDNLQLVKNKAGNTYGTYSQQAQPWLLLVLESPGATAVLKNSAGVEIPWQETNAFHEGENGYVTQLNIMAKTRKYTVMVIPENGQEKDAKTYDIRINPSVQAPAAPTNVRASIFGGNVLVGWNNVHNADGYYIYRSDATGKQYKKIGTVSGGGCSYTDQGAANLKSARYKVAAYASPYGKAARGAASISTGIK